MDIVKVFGLNVKKYRKSINMSQEELAEKSNLHRTYISAIERGKRSIALDNIEKIADALGVEAYVLLVDDSQEEPDDQKGAIL